MAATILDGAKLAGDIRAEVAAEVRSLAEAGVRPGLAVVLAGHNPASEIYVRGKVKACEEVGIYSEKHTPPDSATTAELLALVEHLNQAGGTGGTSGSRDSGDSRGPACRPDKPESAATLGLP
jgi:methylenetetrahydrofolate dehydrogenase (NADP+)/methenyltetrahydrofolate cyclohydrolase